MYFDYNLEDALEAMLQVLPKKIKEKFSYDDLFAILEIEELLLDECGVNVQENEKERICEIPIEPDWDYIKYQMIHLACKKGIYLSFEELEQILEAELYYYKINGAVEEDGRSFLN